MKQRYATFLGTGSFLPERILSNQDLEQRLDTSDAWIVSRTGIKERRLAGPKDNTITMGAQAAQRALEAAGCAPCEVDLIIVATATPEHLFPATACSIQALIGASNAAAFDVQAACSGFVYALSIADQFIKTGAHQKVLIIGTEVLSRVTNFEDRSTCILFGDGAGAVLLGVSDEPGVIATDLFSSGQEAQLLYANQWHNLADDETHPVIRMEGNKVFKLAVERLEALVVNSLAKVGMHSDQIDWLVPHQANIRIIEATARRLALPMSRVLCTLQAHGNTSAASIPLALDAGIRDGRIVRGQHLLLEAFGGGLTWGAAILRY